jgi:excisionase family DNA binding protein
MKATRTPRPVIVREGWATPGAFADSVETAEFLRLQVSTVQRWARCGELPAIKLGGDHGPLRFRKLDVEKWASRQPKAGH